MQLLHLSKEQFVLNKGRALCADDKAISPYYEDIFELLNVVKIDGKSIEEVFNEVDDYYIL